MKNVGKNSYSQPYKHTLSPPSLVQVKWVHSCWYLGAMHHRLTWWLSTYLWKLSQEVSMQISLCLVYRKHKSSLTAWKQIWRGLWENITINHRENFTFLKGRKFVSEDHLQGHDQKQPHASFVDFVVRTLWQDLFMVARICYDCDTNSLRMSLKQ